MTDERKEQYKTLLILCAFFALVAWRMHNIYLAVAVILLLVLGLVSTSLLQKITNIWIKIGEAVGSVMSRVILSVVFILVLSPMAILYRMLNGKKKEKKETYFVERNHTYTAADLEKIF